MAENIVLESIKARMKRFEVARGQRERWDQEFNQAYRFMMPNRLLLVEATNQRQTNTGETNRGENRMDEIFDPTGIEALQAFANNIQTSLMPAFQRWAELEVNDEIKNLTGPFFTQFGEINDSTIDQIRDQLLTANKLLFLHFEKSRLSQVVHEAFLDVGISTGVIVLDAGERLDDDPLKFQAVPANQIIIEGGPDQTLSNFWQPMHVRARDIPLKWPKAKFSDKLQRQINNDPDSFVDLIQSSLHYPQNPPENRFYFSVVVQKGNEEIITEWRTHDPYIAFRASKSPGEVYGRGPALTALPFVRVLNKLGEFMLRAQQLRAYPIFQVEDTSDINPYTLKIEPASVVPVSSEMMRSGGGIRALDLGRPPNDVREDIQEMRFRVREMMFANPLGPTGLPNKTATEATLINTNWIRKNAGFFSRLAVELFPQLINKSLHVLTEKGIIQPLQINNQTIPLTIDGLFVKLKFNNPLARLQDQEELEAIVQALEFAQRAFGQQEGVLAFNIGELSEAVSHRLKVPQDLINEAFKNSTLVRGLKAIMNQPPQAAQAPSAPGGGSAGIPPTPGVSP